MYFKWVKMGHFISIKSANFVSFLTCMQSLVIFGAWQVGQMKNNRVFAMQGAALLQSSPSLGVRPELNLQFFLHASVNKQRVK